MIVSSGPPAKFHAGQLVRHKRYGYRGVVVEIDPFCKAPDSWYEKNRTQPLRDQPWYHVLVDASSDITYAAQTSLEEADQIAPVTHPLVDVFFSGFEGESYVRNDHAWPGQWE